MATSHAEYWGRVEGDRVWEWTLDYDDVANTVTVDSKLTRNGLPVGANAGETGGVVVTKTNGQDQSFDFIAMGLVNSGPQVFPNIRVKLNQQGRDSWLQLSPFFTVP